MRRPRPFRSGPGGAAGCAGSRRSRSCERGVRGVSPAAPPAPLRPGPLCGASRRLPGETGELRAPRRVRRGLEAGHGRAGGRRPGHGGAGAPAARAELPAAGAAAEAARPALAPALLLGLAAARPDRRAERGAHRRAAGAGLRRGGRAASPGGWPCPVDVGARCPPAARRRAGRGGLGGREPVLVPSPVFQGRKPQAPSVCSGLAGGTRGQPSPPRLGGVWRFPAAPRALCPVLLLSPCSTASILPSWAASSTASWAPPRT